MKIQNHHLLVECEKCKDGEIESHTQTIPPLIVYAKCPYCKEGYQSHKLTPEQEQELEGLLRLRKPILINDGSEAYPDIVFENELEEYNQAQSRIAEILTELKTKT